LNSQIQERKKAGAGLDSLREKGARILGREKTRVKRPPKESRRRRKPTPQRGE